MNDWIETIKTARLPKLKAGAHSSPSDGLCALEMVAFIERLPHSDAPPCTCPVLAAYVRVGNDWLDDSERQRLLGLCREILIKLAAVPPQLTTARLDQARLLWEMDFFLQHFLPHYPAAGQTSETVGAGLARVVVNIDAEDTFAHRDFHLRNLLVQCGEIVIVDFQDSLLAPRYYDLVSLAYDSYLDLGRAREILLSGVDWTANERRQLRLTALQRNIKALGTFAYQVRERGHATYGKYIPRTLRHIKSHLSELADPGFEVLAKYFAAVMRNG